MRDLGARGSGQSPGLARYPSRKRREMSKTDQDTRSAMLEADENRTMRNKDTSDA
jgi:hypothetical protein